MIRLSVLTLALSATSSLAYAQGGPDREGWSATLGAGVLYSPTYEGDDDNSLSVLPNIQIRHGDTFFASVQEGIGYNLVNTDAFKIGPIAKVRFSRDEEGGQTFAVSGEETSDLIGLGDVDTSVEVGGFISYEIGDVTLGAEARQAVSGHDGMVVDLGARWKGRTVSSRQSILWSVGPRLRLVDDTYNAAYFGVTAQQAIASGLPQYDAGGGLHSYGIGATAVVPFDKAGKWSAVFIAGYDRLAGDAGDAPLVRLRGDVDQVTLGVFVSRTFN
jgi:outer membrane protein